MFNRKKLVLLQGFSTLELLLAGAIFVLFAWGVIQVLLMGLRSDQQAREMTGASFYATQGMEAVRMMKDNDFDSLTVTEATGITKENDTWVFSGTQDALESFYTRTITVVQGKRDGDGFLTDGDGTEDPDTVKVTVTVSWQITPSRSDQVVLETYLTRWKTEVL